MTRVLAIAIALGVIAAALIGTWVWGVEQQLQRKRYLMVDAGPPLARGSKVDVSKLKYIDLPSDVDLSKVLIEDNEMNRAWIAGRTLTTTLASNNVLLFQYFSEDAGLGLAGRIRPDRRAYAIPVSPATAVANLVEPGSYVDVITAVEKSTPGGAGAQPQLEGRIVLEGVRVLAVGTATSKSPYENLAEKGYSTVTLEVTLEQAAELAALMGRDQKSFTLLLRNSAPLGSGADTAERAK